MEFRTLGGYRESQQPSFVLFFFFFFFVFFFFLGTARQRTEIPNKGQGPNEDRPSQTYRKKQSP